MKSFAWLRARPRTLASAGVVTASALAITLLAVGYEGFPTTEVDLHDGGVWVTKSSSLLVGHFNHESQVLDGGLRTTSDEYDILQAGETVLVVDSGDATVTTIDPALVVLTDSAQLPAGAEVALGGPTVAVLEPSSGDLWVVPAQGISAFEFQGTDPIATLGEGADVTVGTDGTVFAASTADSAILTIPVDAEGAPGEPSSRGVDADLRDATITAVGNVGVVLDAASGTLHTTEGRTLEVDEADTAVLQQPSAAADAVTLSTASSLVRVPFDGSEPSVTRAGGDGAPAAPVWLKGCAYAAWSGSATFARDCVGEASDMKGDVDGADGESLLRFRVNRDVVVLNDIIGGAAWMASESMQRVDNWQDVTPPEGETEEDEQTTEESVETTLPERSDINTPPIANPDEFGVRPGRTTSLPVLDNDSDADGDVLAASVSGGGPGFGTVQQVNNGAALQVAVPEDAEGSTTFAYEVDDGRGGTATASVSLTVHGFEMNSPPTQKRTTTVTVESGGTVSYNVLPDWIDPDGDDVFLKSVVATDGDEADFTSDGRITYRAFGGTQGRKEVAIVVSDGTDEAAGVVRFDVRPVGSTVPVTNADHVVVRTGQTVTVAPLVNDTSSGREPLRLTRVDETPGATIVPDFANKTFTFSSNTADVYYVQYLVAAGANAVPGLVRVDVIDGPGDDLPPIAVRDIALLPSGGEVLVNVLSNDTDPAGGILVVQSVTVAPGTGVAVAVLNHETLRIADQTALSEQVRITYRISNGSKTAEGEVVIIPVPAPAQLRPPVANDDSAIVRAGDVVTIPVLENDYHPNGDKIHVAADLVAPLPDPADGDVFISQDTVRFKAGDKPGTVYATYEVEDSSGQKDAGYITIQVLPVNAETNAAPRPRDLTSRVLSGSRVRVAVPLDGIDPDGDSVQLVGVDKAPTKGRIVETGADYLLYEAFEGSTGVDAFTYRVRDRLGKEATAPIRIGIAPAEGVNQAPYAVKDAVIMRPGRTVAVPVTANDSDPDGDQFGLVKDGLILPDVDGLKAVVQGGDRVVVTSPDQPVETSLQYTIRDARGAEAKAVLQITVAEDVPLQRPIARDDRVLAQDLTDEDTVDVEVLANDEDPDGTREALEITVQGDDARVLANNRIRVTPGETDQLLTYTITDEDGLAASAFIFVPALDSVPPVAKTTGVEVRSGETIEIPLADHVQAAGGKQVVITEAERVSAVHANGAALVKDEKTLVYTSADRYFGQDAITFEVTDGTSPEDPKGRKATLSIPITVLPPENQQPSFVDGQLDVAPGEQATTLDLRALTTDPDPDDLAGMSYRIVGSAPSGYAASVDGANLQVSADAATPKGSTTVLTVEISDGETDPVRGSVTVRVTASTRPLATANDDTVAEAFQGRTTAVPVLGNDFNPFPDTPLTLMSASTETGIGTAKVVGDRVEVVPDKDFFGTMVVRYRIADATKDPDREVEGRVRLTVQGRPDAPGTPTVSSVQDKTVVLAWSPPPNNGSVITGYTVKSTSGAYTRECPATTCTLTGLTNNVEYNFVVTATNAVGTSEPSAASETARPDARPDTPNPPALVFGDRSLDVTWTTPSTPGSPVSHFTLEISPAPPSGITQKTNVAGNSIRWEGLENGTNYQVRVQAHNRAPEPSMWSGYSQPMVPAAPPAAAGAPSTTRLDPVPPRAQMQVAWNPPANNGDAISEYRLNIIRGGSVVSTITGIAGSQTTQAVAIDASTTDYTFTVAARNKAGWGADSAASAPRRAFTAPGAPTGVTASTPAPDSSIVVSYTPGAANGANSGEMRYEYNVGGNWAPLNNNRITGLSNGTSYTVKVRAVTALDGVTYYGAESAPSGAVVPYGVLGAPSVSAVNNGTSITLNWASPAGNGRTQQMYISVNGGGWQPVGASGSQTHGNGYDQTYSIRARVTDNANPAQAAESNTASAKTNSPPPPTTWAISAPTYATCVQPDFNYSRYNANGPSCSSYWLRASDGPQTVTCFINMWNVESDTVWYWIPSRGVYMSRAGTTGNAAGMPGC